MFFFKVLAFYLYVKISFSVLDTFKNNGSENILDFILIELEVFSYFFSYLGEENSIP